MSDGALVIRGARVVDPASGHDAPAEVLVAGGRIVAVGEAGAAAGGARIIDATGCLVFPGAVDLCARLREPGLEHKATIESEAGAAACGGITTVCVPPDTDPVIDTPAVVELIHRRAAESGRVRVEALGALSQGLAGTQLAELGALGAAGCVGVSNGRNPLPDAKVMRRALEYAATFDLTVHLWPEEASLAGGGCVHEGAVSTRLGLPGIPETAETVAVARDLLLVEQAGVRAHFCRLSTAGAVRMIAEARARGLPVSADVAVHQLLFTEDDVSGFDSLCHVRPPLRTAADRKALREALAAGVIDAVCSDHQPHEPDAKLNPFSQTEPGISGLESLLALLLGLVDEGVLDLGRAVDALTAAPARVLGLERGVLAPGAAADLCVVDPARVWRLAEEGMRSRGHNTPFLHRPLRHRVTLTVLGGRIVHEAGA